MNSFPILGSKLPWTIKLDNTTIFTISSILSTNETSDILEKCSFSATLAVTTKYHPPASDHISTLALCIHSHMNLLVAKLSDLQVILFEVPFYFEEYSEIVFCGVIHSLSKSHVRKYN